MIEHIVAKCPGQHVYLFTDDTAIGFYKRLGFVERGIGLQIVVGKWLDNADISDWKLAG
jgi:hypothetical protein